MKISKITVQKKRKDRYNIFTVENQQEQYAFSVDEDVLVKFQLKKGKELQPDEIERILQADQLRKAVNDAVHYLSYSMRTEQQVIEYLLKKEYTNNVISQAMSKIKDYGYTDDTEFAGAFVRTKMKTTDKGPLLIKEELRRKGVSEEKTEKAMEQFTPEQELEAAQRVVQKKAASKKNESLQAMKQRLLQSLRQKGYSNEAAVQAVGKLSVQRSEEEERQAVRVQGEKAKKRWGKKYTGRQLEWKLKEFLYRKGFSMDVIQQYLQEVEQWEDENDGKTI
ncbi:regulatory protein [Alteribacillus persepolensis]|uniref:Regulatory protein RecX n=1 Tax=Alteribacillus persepolensis TaxID=568899 RepID=A0A1G8CCM9_9BACI|nr:recombination regulator RecX [Alteribacillus persepolensis]SDH43138.1 regulatory protein [Alteribacillus persepolensis]